MVEGLACFRVDISQKSKILKRGVEDPLSFSSPSPLKERYER